MLFCGLLDTCHNASHDWAFTGFDGLMCVGDPKAGAAFRLPQQMAHWKAHSACTFLSLFTRAVCACVCVCVCVCVHACVYAHNDAECQFVSCGAALAVLCRL